jgi:putative ABC transport system permease protein
VGVGDTMQVLDNRYKVVGIFETGVAFEDASGMLALREAQRLMGRPRAVTFIFVDVAQPSQAPAVVDAINRRFPEARASISSEFAQSTNDLQTTLGMMEAIRWLALFVGGIVVANTMIMSIFERTREIGTLRALGWRPRRIIGQILLESLFLCIVAAVLGSLIGVGLFNLAPFCPQHGMWRYSPPRFSRPACLASWAASSPPGAPAGWSRRRHCGTSRKSPISTLQSPDEIGE